MDVQPSFADVCRVPTSLFQFSRKLAINHRQWLKVRTGLSLRISPLKSASRNSRTKRPQAKPDETLRLACLVNSSNRRTFKHGKYVDDKEFNQARKCLEAGSK